MADLQQPITKQKLQALLTQLLRGVTDEQLQQLQSQIDVPAMEAEPSHHDHDHPSLQESRPRDGPRNHDHDDAE